jgi:hypothetical protein
MTTLRRELRTKFEVILKAFEDKLSQAEREATAELLADAALEVRGIARITAVETKGDLLDGMLAYSQPQPEMDTLHDFERAFGFGALPWYSNTVWDKFAKFLIKSGGQWFTDYLVWRNGDGKYKAFSNKKIRENPAAFMDTGYPEYEASKMYRKTDETRPEYQPFPFSDSAA